MEPKLSVLIVEDMKDELHRYVGFVKMLGHSVVGVDSLTDALKLLRKMPFNVVLADMHLSGASPQTEGLALLKELKDCHGHVLPIAMS